MLSDKSSSLPLSCLALHRPRLLLRLRLLLASLLGCENRVQSVTFLAGPELHDAFLANVFNQTLQDFAPQIRTRHFAAAEEDGGLDLVSLVKESQYVVLLGLVIVVIHVDAELHFLDGDYFLMFFGLALFLLLLVQVFPVIHDAAYRRISGGRNLNQVQVLFAGHFQRFVRRDDANLLAFIINHADFPGANTLIDADKTFVDTGLRAQQGDWNAKL